LLSIKQQVPSKTKTKIWANEYLDFGTFLVTNPQQEKFSLALSPITSASAQPKLTIEPAQPAKKITGINQWLTAFHNYCAIYLVKFQSTTPRLMKYGEIVRDLAVKPVDWLFYFMTSSFVICVNLSQIGALGMGYTGRDG
jgi:hypothetical protein